MTRTVLLGDEIELIGGGTPKTNISEYWHGDIPWLSVVDFGGGSRWVDHTEKFISKEGLKNSSTKVLETGDIIISARGTVGELAQLTSPMAFNQSCYGVRAKDSLNQDYLYYLLKHSISDLQRQSHGGVFSTITRETFQHIKVLLPDITDQKKIANILGQIDENIELNRQMNVTLEQMGKTLFKHYFIDNPEADDWDEKSLDEVANFLNGVAMQKFPDDGGPTLPVIKIREMSGGITSNTDIGSANIPEKYIVHDGDILFSWSGTLIVKPWCDGEGALNQHLFKVTSDEYPKWFYYYWTKYHLQSFIETAAGKATTMGHIQRQHLTDAKVKVPSEDQLAEITQVMKPILDKQIANELEGRKLVNLRDSLLPRLISGKISV
jgi:type I restriction enzyme S subunit